MKLLYIVRHAKSDWGNADLPDIDRPLNERGYRDAHAMGEWLDKNGHTPELMISSPAVRALSTALIFARKLQYPADLIEIKSRIYESAPSTISDIVSNLPQKLKKVMLFGHNPTLTAVAGELSGIPFDNIPTCGIVCVKFDAPTWANAVEVSGGLHFFQYPKNFV